MWGKEGSKNRGGGQNVWEPFHQTYYVDNHFFSLLSASNQVETTTTTIATTTTSPSFPEVLHVSGVSDTVAWSLYNGQYKKSPTLQSNNAPVYQLISGPTYQSHHGDRYLNHGNDVIWYFSEQHSGSTGEVKSKQSSPTPWEPSIGWVYWLNGWQEENVLFEGKIPVLIK